MSSLKEKILNRTAKIGIIGLGYVGLPLVVEFAKAGFQVTGIDVNKERVDNVNDGISYIIDVRDDVLSPLTKEGRITATTKFDVLKELDAISICVPTPLRKSKDPDISYIVASVNNIKKYLRKGQLVVLESTTYPGTTDELLLPELESTGLKVGKDFYLAFSPERVDPGNKEFQTKNTPKIIGGVTQQCTQIAKLLYEQSVEKVIPVSSTMSAEMVKLLENTFRSVNIGLVNEIALICDKLKIDVWEVIEAAATKPFGFMPFYPGPGLGGHCIPIDPYYLSWKLKMLNYNARFIELAGEINSHMPDYVVSKIGDSLNNVKKSINGSKILILGVAYKKDVSDIRESPALDIIKILQGKGAQIFYHDPYVPKLKLEGLDLQMSDLNENLLREVDCIVITTNHSSYDYKWIVENAVLVVDTRNATRGIVNTDKIVKI